VVILAFPRSRPSHKSVGSVILLKTPGAADFVGRVEDMINLRIPLFPTARFTGIEKIFATVPAADPTMTGHIQAVADVEVVNRGHVTEQRFHITCRVYLSAIGISWTARHDRIGAVRIRRAPRKR